MKKVLILAYDFPPYISAGGFRPYSWYQHMHELGMYPIVVTRQWSNEHRNHLDYISPSDSSETIVKKTDQGTLINAPYFPSLSNRLLLRYGDSKYKLLRKAISALIEILQFLFLVGPKSQLYYAADEYLKNNEVDCIIATGDPFILFKYASILSNKYSTPWIADYRDPWAQDVSIQSSFLVKLWSSYWEKRIVKNAKFILTVSDFCKFHISQLLKAKKIHILPNGYDPKAFDNLKEIKQESEMLNIAFTGTIEDWHPIQSILETFNKFLSDNKGFKLQLNFYGINMPIKLDALITSEFPDLKDTITILPKMSHDELLKKLASNNLMLLFNSYAHMGTKIYDYIGINRPILFCYSDDEDSRILKTKHYRIEDFEGRNDHLQEELVKATNSGYVVKDAAHLYNLLGELYRELQNVGSIKQSTINTENLTRKHQVKKLVELINSIS